MKLWNFWQKKLKAGTPARESSELDFLDNKTIALTGPDSMIGQHITNFLKNNCPETVYTRLGTSNHTSHFDLTNLQDARHIMAFWQPDYVIHLASLNGNIKYNSEHPAEIFYTTSQCAINVLKAAAEYTSDKKPIKVISILSSCSYPDSDDGILREAEYWNGSPNPTVEAHGFAKRIIPEFGRQLWKQRGLESVSVVYNTAFGPYDNTNVDKTKVVMGLIKKFVNAKREDLPCVELWGSGKPRREFIFAGDIARTIPWVMEYYHDCWEPINIGSGDEYSIDGLANLVKELVGYKGRIVWKDEMLDGQMRKLLDNNKWKRLCPAATNFKFTPFLDALVDTIDWYENVSK